MIAPWYYVFDWLRRFNPRYCPEWDAELNRLIASGRFTDVTRYDAKIDGIRVWIANHPYASFQHQLSGALPLWTTAIRAKRKLAMDCIANHREKIADAEQEQSDLVESTVASMPIYCDSNTIPSVDEQNTYTRAMILQDDCCKSDGGFLRDEQQVPWKKQ